jgi:hypothetical protein
VDQTHGGGIFNMFRPSSLLYFYLGIFIFIFIFIIFSFGVSKIGCFSNITN